MKAKSININFFKTWTSDMAYILGFLFADGSVTKNRRGGYYVTFYSMDKSLLCSIKKAMKSEHVVAQRNAVSGLVYRLQVGSKDMVSDLEKIGLKQTKTKRMKVPEIPSRYQGHFIRGFFDGDGNVWTGYINKKRRMPTYIIQTSFTSASEVFLQDVCKLLKRSLGTTGSLSYIKNKNCHRLSYSIKDSLKLYDFMYNTGRTSLFLLRKERVFKKYMNTRL